jgi:thiol-disulfide isomerase/thioredoxin
VSLETADAFVEGKVVDEKGRPVSGVSVMVDPYMREPVVTDSEGKFRVESIPKGHVSIRAFQHRNLVERSIDTGKAAILVLKAEPDEATPAVATEVVKAGTKAIELTTDGWVNSKPMSLASLKGKIVVLDFWAIWCGPCKRELPHVEVLAKRFAGQPVVVIGVHDSTAISSELVTFAKAHGLTYALAIDKKSTDGFGITANAYGVQGIPMMVVIDKTGKVTKIPESAVDAEAIVAKLLKK